MPGCFEEIRSHNCMCSNQLDWPCHPGSSAAVAAALSPLPRPAPRCFDTPAGLRPLPLLPPDSPTLPASRCRHRSARLSRSPEGRGWLLPSAAASTLRWAPAGRPALLASSARGLHSPGKSCSGSRPTKCSSVPSGSAPSRRRRRSVAAKMEEQRGSWLGSSTLPICSCCCCVNVQPACEGSAAG